MGLWWKVGQEKTQRRSAGALYDWRLLLLLVCTNRRTKSASYHMAYLPATQHTHACTHTHLYGHLIVNLFQATLCIKQMHKTKRKESKPKTVGTTKFKFVLFSTEQKNKKQRKTHGKDQSSFFFFFLNSLWFLELVNVCSGLWWFGALDQNAAWKHQPQYRTGI